MNNIERIRVEDIKVEDGFNARQSIPEADVNALRLSFADVGQIQPIIVEKIDGDYVLRAGEKRLGAARVKGDDFIAASVYEGLSDRERLFIMADENMQRRDLNVVEQAGLFARMMETGMAVAEIASRFKRSVDFVQSRLDVLDLPDEVRRLMLRDVHPLPIHQALKLKGIADSDAVQLARKIAPVTGPVMREHEARDLVREYKERFQAKIEPTEPKAPPKRTECGDVVPEQVNSECSPPSEQGTGVVDSDEFGQRSSVETAPTIESEAPDPGPHEQKSCVIRGGKARINGELIVKDGGVYINQAVIIIDSDSGFKKMEISPLYLDIGSDDIDKVKDFLACVQAE